MKQSGFVRCCAWPTRVNRLAAWSLSSVCFRSRAYYGRWLFCIAVLPLFLSGCASEPRVLSESSGSSELSDSHFGKIALVDESGRASFSFQKAKGKLGSDKEALVESAEMGLSGPGAGVILTGAALSEMRDCNVQDGAGEVILAGAVGGVAAVGAVLVGPAVGAKGLIRSMQKVSPAELAQREKELTQALAQMAQQNHLHAALQEIGQERIQGGFVEHTPSPSSEGPVNEGVAAFLEAWVDDLRLERAGSSEGSYFLRIRSHARLVRVADGAVLLQQKAEYRSGTDLFLDWTMYGAVEGVAETGYRELARYYVGQLMTGEKQARRR